MTASVAVTLDPPTEVSNCLRIGHIGHLRNPSLLYGLGISYVLDLAAMSKASELPRDFNTLRVPLSDDGANNVVDLRTAILGLKIFLEAARERQGVVLVCCEAGLSRSPLICAATLYAMGEYRSFSEALEAIKVIRGKADYSPALMCSIEQALMGMLVRGQIS